MKQIYVVFVRHGFSHANLAKKVSRFGCIWRNGCPRFTQSIKNKFCQDSGITSIGKEQLKCAGRRASKTLALHKDMVLYTDEVFTSGLSRTVESAASFVEGYNDQHLVPITRRITPVPYISEKRTGGCLFKDLDNEVRPIEQLQEEMPDTFTVSPLTPVGKKSKGWGRPSATKFKQGILPLIAERAAKKGANTIIVFSHKKTIRSLLGKTLGNGEMAIQQFDVERGTAIGEPRMVQGYDKDREIVHTVENLRLQGVIGKRRSIAFSSY